MADGVSADQMADLFGRVFHMVGSAFDCLCHGNYVNAVGTTESHFRFKASHYDQIVQTVSLAVGAQNFQCAGMIARGEGLFGSASILESTASMSPKSRRSCVSSRV